MYACACTPNPLAKIFVLKCISLHGYDSSKEHAERFPEGGVEQSRDHRADSAEDRHPEYVRARLGAVVRSLGEGE